MKKTKRILFLICLMIITTGCSNNKQEKVMELTKIESVKSDMTKYLDFKDLDHVYQTVTYEQLNKLFSEKGTGVVYLGYVGCPWCEEAVPILDTIAKRYEGITIYTSKDYVEGEDKAAYEKAVDQFKTYALPNEDTMYVPHVFVIVDGKVVDDNMGTVNGHNAHERKMTDDEVKQLEKIYTRMLDKLVTNK